MAAVIFNNPMSRVTPPREYKTYIMSLTIMLNSFLRKYLREESNRHILTTVVKKIDVVKIKRAK